MRAKNKDAALATRRPWESKALKQLLESQISLPKASTPPLFIETFDVPTGGLFEPAQPGFSFRESSRYARAGEAVQIIFWPNLVSRRGLISNRDLLAVHRLNSEADVTLIKGLMGEWFVLMPESTFLADERFDLGQPSDAS